MPTPTGQEFTHLHVHTEFSLLDGLGRIDDLVGQASAQGFDSLAITDHGALYGAVAFYQACRAREIKPLIGVETYVARRSMADREGKADAQPYHLILLARDWTGYQNLCRIVTDAHLDGYYYKPRIDREYLARHAQGLVGLSACLNGEIPRALEVDDWELARNLTGEYRDILGAGNFFLEVQDHGLPEQRRLTEQLVRLGPEVGVPLVGTNDLHYVHRAQAEAHDVLLCIGTASNLDTPNRMRFETPGVLPQVRRRDGGALRGHPGGRQQHPSRGRDVRRDAAAGAARASRTSPCPRATPSRAGCAPSASAASPRATGRSRPSSTSAWSTSWASSCTMGYAGYFLIVADFTRFAREQGIATTCRGSAPGSIVTYTLGITPVDPIKYDLPFERFLNPDRVTMPDIDMDFEDNRRDEVIAYVTHKYGADHVAQIITFGTMLARAAIRDVGRVLGFGYGEVDRIAKAVPNQLGIKLDEALETSPDLRAQVDADPRVDRLIGLAKQVEGVARNASTHAAGVVISREPLTDLMPLQRATNSDSLMTQIEMHGVEALGLLKFDFLGLSNLTILRQAVDLIAQQRGERIDLEHIPLDDTRTFDLLASGETTGVFQLESPGMRRYVKDLRPTSVLDLAAMVALYRPGPMDNIPAYIRRKHGLEPVTYLHPLLEPYLEKTYGIFVYQEDIMSAARALGGFTGPEADTLGYAIRKKKSSVLRAQKERFVTRAAERGVSPAVIDAVFKAFEPFERYGFNKAHATCYGLIAYQTAYLKANYTVEYMASVLTAVRDTAERVAAAIAECRRLGIEVRPPDVERSELDFTVEDDAIRFGLQAVKNVGQGAIESIIAARTAEGPFRSLADLCARVDLRLVNRRVLESLVKVGALDRLGHPAQLLDALDDALAAGQATQRDRLTGQTSLFDLAADSVELEKPLPVRSEAPLRERLRWEKELLGLYLSDHPLGEIAEPLGRFVTAYSGELNEELDQQRVVLGGIVTGMRTVITKSKSTMGVAMLEDLQGSLEVVVFPKVLEQTSAVVAHRGDRPRVRAGRPQGRVGRPAGRRRCGTGTRRWPWARRRSRGWWRPGSAVAAAGRGHGRPDANGNGNGHAAGRAAAGQPRGAGDGGGLPDASHPVGLAAPRRRRFAGELEWRLGAPARPVAVAVGNGDGEAAPVAVMDPAMAAPGPGDGLPEPESLNGLGESDEPPFPAEAWQPVARSAAAPTSTAVARHDQALHVRFVSGAPDTLAAAFESLKLILREHPGETAVVVELPAARGASQAMPLRAGVAYDSELLAAIERRLGAGLVRVELLPA